MEEPGTPSVMAMEQISPDGSLASPDGSETCSLHPSDSHLLTPRSRNNSKRNQLCSPSTYVYVTAVLSACGGILFGYDVGIISGALLQLKDKFVLTCIQQEIVVSSVLIGALIASLTGGFLVDHFGRRRSIIGNAALFILGAVLLALAPSYSLLICGRLVVGFAVSLSATAECTYISEIAPVNRRGLLVSLNELGITLGFLLAYLVNFGFITFHDGWRYMFGLSALPAIVQGMGMLFMPASPRFLMIKQQRDKAAEMLHKLRGPNKVEDELEAIHMSLYQQQGGSFLDLFRSKDNMRNRLLVGIAIVLFQQVTGQPSVLYYAPLLFQSIGFKSDSAATLAAVGLGVVKVVLTGVTLLCVDRLGRRKFLLTGVGLMAVGISVLGITTVISGPETKQTSCWDSPDVSPAYSMNSTFSIERPVSKHHETLRVKRNAQYVLSYRIMHTEDDLRLLEARIREKRHSVIENWPGLSYSVSLMVDQHNGTESGPASVPARMRWLALIALMTYVAGYAVGFGPVSWLILSEIFPSSIRGRAVSFVTVFNWGANLLVSITFLDFSNALGVGWAFLIYGSVCVTAVIFIYCCVPETKGRSLEQISQDLKTRSILGRRHSQVRLGQSHFRHRTSNSLYQPVMEQDSIQVDLENPEL